MNYPDDIDKEFTPYLDKLNSFNWFESTFSCTGHKRPNYNHTGYLSFYIRKDKFLELSLRMEEVLDISPTNWATLIARDGKIGFSMYYSYVAFKETVEKLIEICEEINNSNKQFYIKLIDLYFEMCNGQSDILSLIYLRNEYCKKNNITRKKFQELFDNIDLDTEKYHISLGKPMQNHTKYIRYKYDPILTIFIRKKDKRS